MKVPPHDHQHEPLNFKRNFAGILIIVLLAFLAYALLPYATAFFGALILFVLFRPLFISLRKSMSKQRAAIAIILISLVVVIVPGFIVISAIASQAGGVVVGVANFSQWFRGVDTLFGVDVQALAIELAAGAGEYAKSLVFSIIGGITRLVITTFIMYAALYYMFVNADQLRRFLHSIVPFSERHSQRLVDEFNTITHSMVVGTCLIALLQGTLLGLSFWLFGVPAPLFWGFIGAILSFLPVFGTSLLWVPAAALKLIAGQYGPAIGLAASGCFIGLVDNVIRPAISKKVGNVHPLITIVGVFLGIPFFGVLGVVVGPLLLSYLFLMMRMFKEEYF